MLPKWFVAVPIAAIAVVGIGGSTACASKKFVRTSVGEVNDKVDSLGRSVEETQERTRRNEGRISEVDQKAQAADSKAQAASQSALQANDAASAANSAAKDAGNKFDVMDKANRRLVYEVVLSEDQGNFKFGKATLPDVAKQRLDEMVAQLKQDPKAIFLEIEGHTDNIGGKMINEKVGLERAEAVKRYLYEQYQIPLHKMNVISYGEDKPIAPNKTREGRAQNRRVVIKVLA
ncbi:MAG TPA: OmpA family protein [Vicinamibacterales bacterium]|jgi:outer membrane protein OmpA-like peptidoglycan-associated protein|nr:OmpA family protein [Vicinamibacterales bacterium]